MPLDSSLSQTSKENIKDDSSAFTLNARTWETQKSQIAKLRLLREVIEDARLHSEVRYLGTLVHKFCADLDTYTTNEKKELPPSLNREQKESLISLYTRFNAEISLLCSGIITDRNSSFVYYLESMLRTPLEEAILSIELQEPSSYENPAVVRECLIDGYRSARESSLEISRSLVQHLQPYLPLPTVWIHEFQAGAPELSDLECSELLALVNTRVVDTTTRERREGFGRKYSLEEFNTLLHRSTTHVYVPYTSDGPLGIYTIDSTIENQPASVQAALREKFFKDPPLSESGWVDITALAGNARDRLRSPCDAWLVARDNSSQHPDSRVVLEPTDATHVGPGDFLVDSLGQLHLISHNSAFKKSNPSDWEITTRDGDVLRKIQIRLYLKSHSLNGVLPDLHERSHTSDFYIESILQPTAVTEVGPGDYVRTRTGEMNEIERNSALGAMTPKSWSIQTKNGETLGVYDVHSYLKCTTKSADALESLHAPSLYRWLTVAACESALSLGIHSLFCQVRIGYNGNTAREKHIAVGWEPTGIVFSVGDFKYEILRLDPYRILTGVSYVEVSHLFTETSLLKEEQDQLRLFAKSVWASPPTVNDQSDALERIQAKFPTCTVEYSLDQLHRLQVKVSSDSNAPTYFIQGAAHADVWRVQKDLLYTRSLFNKLTSLDHALRHTHL